jgi:dTDP-4-amino-4,6-dideoxygalactose transaminase
MIPRFKPYLNNRELIAVFKPDSRAVERFEKEFACTFEAKHALAFSYGRSALWAFFKAMAIHDAEIIMPAYTCSVVAHAIVLSGNIPRFVDITLHDYNMDLDQVAEALNENTKAIIATHLFGYPLDVDRLMGIVREAENRYGHKIWVIQDCAHSFGAKWKGKLVCNVGDAAIFGLNISKMITSIFGGMITTNNDDLYNKLKAYRDLYFKKPGYCKTIRRLIYLLAVYLAFNEKTYGLVYWLQEKTSFLNKLTKAYHLDDKIHFPPDYLDQMLPIEARVGLEQLKKYPEIICKRKEAAIYYDKNLTVKKGWIKPPLVDGATYSHYVVRIPDREKIMQEMAEKGLQLGKVIEYLIPNLASYKSLNYDKHFINSIMLSTLTINLPVWGGKILSREVSKFI